LSAPELADRLLPHLVADGVLAPEPGKDDQQRLVQLAALVGTRIVVIADATPLVRPFFLADDQIEIADDARAQLGEGSADVLDAAAAALSALGDDWTAAAIEAALRAAIVDGLGIKARLAFGPLRTAVSGQKVSPPLFESMEILGSDATLARIRALRSSL
jgi:glutamyl-tRNA synthetase